MQSENVVTLNIPLVYSRLEMLYAEFYAQDVAKDLLHAVVFASKKHAGQLSYDGSDPFFSHLLGVASLVVTHSTEDPSPAKFVAALLFATLEMTDTTYEELKEVFGEHIAETVRELSGDISLSKAERKRLQIVHAKQLSDDAQMIRLCEILYSLRALLASQPAYWSVQFTQGFFLWSKAVVAAIRSNEDKCGKRKSVEADLDKAFTAEFFHVPTNRSYPCFPTDDVEKCLEHYYLLL